jgi:excisionase family DNA binding protein
MKSTSSSPAAGSPSPFLLDVQAVAQLLGCSARHVYRLCDSGKMPAPVRLGSLVRWRRATGDPATGIEDWIAAGCKPVRKAGGRSNDDQQPH